MNPPSPLSNNPVEKFIFMCKWRMAPFKYVCVTSAAHFNSCPMLSCSLLEPALMCLRAAQSWAPGETAWRRRSGKSCSTRLTRRSWTSGAFQRSCRAISWRCSSQSSRSCSAEGTTGVWMCDGWPWRRHLTKTSGAKVRSRVQKKLNRSRITVSLHFVHARFTKELFIHEMKVPSSCSGVAAQIPVPHTQLWNYCFVLGPSRLLIFLCVLLGTERVFMSTVWTAQSGLVCKHRST